MKKILTLSLIIFISFICCKNKKNEFTIVKTSKDSTITIIFKQRTFKKDTLISNSGGKTLRLNDLNYSYVGDFREFQIPKNNLKTNDTLIIKTNTDIILSHGYHYYFNSIYNFKPGDVVIFDYKDDAPNCRVINRSVSYEELNFLKDFNLKAKIIEDEGMFFLNNKRFRNNSEKEEIKNANLKNINLKISLLDSLKLKKLISESTYKMYYDGLNFQMNSINNTIQNLLDKKVDLSLSYNRFNIIDNFNTLYKPILLKESNGSHYDSKKQFDNVLQFNNINPKNKDFLLYNYFKDIVEYASQDEIKKYFSKFSDAVSDKKLIKELSNKFLIDFSSLKNNTKNVYLLNNKREKTDFNELKTNFKGKVLYVDFWASWCAPCRVSMPSSLKLKNKLKNKDVVFLYLSIDNDYEKWQDASKKEGVFLSNNSFIAINYPNAEFYKQLQLKSIPRYMIFDKKGNLVVTNAPSPDSDEIEKVIDKYLKN
jgi:thiol-disulfide isomerase/thioredoxin